MRVAISIFFMVVLFGCGNSAQPDAIQTSAVLTTEGQVVFLDFDVQRYEISIAAGVAETTINPARTIDPLHTRVMMGSLMRQANALTYRTGIDTLESRDINAAVEIQTDGTIKIYSNASAEFDFLVRFSTLQYIGGSGGPNEFLVYRDAKALQTSLLSSSSQLPLGPIATPLNEVGVATATAQKLTVHHLGLRVDVGGGGDTGDVEDQLVLQYLLQYGADVSTPFDNADPTLFLSRNLFTVGSALRGSWEAVNWIGSNWQVEHVPHGLDQTASAQSSFAVYTQQGVDQTITIPDIGDWDHAWIESHRGQQIAVGTFDGMFAAYVRKGSNTTSVELWQPAAADVQALNVGAAVFFVISNPDIYVLHQGVDLGNRTETMAADGPTKLIPLATPNQISAGHPQVISIAGGIEQDGNLGYHDVSVIFVSKDAGVRAFRSEPVGDWMEYIQTIQFESSESIDDQASVIDRPKVTIAFDGQRG